MFDTYGLLMGDQMVSTSFVSLKNGSVLGMMLLAGCGSSDVSEQHSNIRPQAREFDQNLPELDSVEAGTIATEILAARISSRNFKTALQQHTYLRMFSFGEFVGMIDQLIRHLEPKDQIAARNAFRDFKNHHADGYRQLLGLSGLGRSNQLHDIMDADAHIKSILNETTRIVRAYVALESKQYLQQNLDLFARSSDLTSSVNQTTFQVARVLRNQQNGQVTVPNQALCFRMGYVTAKVNAMHRMVRGAVTHGQVSAGVYDAYEKVRISSVELQKICEVAPPSTVPGPNGETTAESFPSPRLREMRTAMARMANQTAEAQALLNRWLEQ
jgi:hypothetical protein